MKNKYNNFIPFLDFLFCITLTYLSLFILSITQIKKIQLDKDKQNNQLQQNIFDLNEKLSINQQILKNAQSSLQDSQSNLKNLEIQKTALSILNKDLNDKIDNIKQENEELKKKGNWKTTAKLAIEVTWPKTINDDIDLYIKTPDNKVVYFNNQVGTGVFIDRDDLGYHEFDEKHLEIANFIRLLDTSTQPYLVNLHAYSKRYQQPTQVNLKLYKINENNSEIIFEKDFLFEKQDQVESVIELYTKKNPKNIEFDKFKESTTIISNLIENAKKIRTITQNQR